MLDFQFFWKKWKSFLSFFYFFKSFFISPFMWGRTMEFTFDIDQTPVIGRRLLNPQVSVGTMSSTTSSNAPSDASTVVGSEGLAALPEGVKASISSMTTLTAGISQATSPRRSSFSPYDAASNPANNTAVPWKRPWQSQARVRERLVNLLNTCGQRVGLPKSPSVSPVFWDLKRNLNLGIKMIKIWG